MLDIKMIRENPELVKENIRKKFQDHKLVLVDEVLELDAQLRAAKTEANDLRANRNALSKKIGMLMGQSKKDPSKLAEAEEVKAEVAKQAEKLREEAVAAGEKLVAAAEEQRAKLIEAASSKGTLAKIAAEKAGDKLVSEAKKQADNLVAKAEEQIAKLQQK